jgi:hypothetical protein
MGPSPLPMMAAMSSATHKRDASLSARLARRLACHQALHDPVRDPRNRLRWLPELRRWQARRLERSFNGFLQDPGTRPAARFFLNDVYGDHDFSRRDADIARVMPMMQGLLPRPLLESVADGIELGALTQAFDLRMAEALDRLAPTRRRLDDALYMRAYGVVGLPHLRGHQIGLIGHVGKGLATALRMPKVGPLLRLSRLPAKAAGLAQLQGFLERGFDAFAQLGDIDGFLADIDRSERAISRRLCAGDSEPFRDE